MYYASRRRGSEDLWPPILTFQPITAAISPERRRSVMELVIEGAAARRYVCKQAPHYRGRMWRKEPIRPSDRRTRTGGIIFLDLNHHRFVGEIIFSLFSWIPAFRVGIFTADTSHYLLGSPPSPPPPADPPPPCDPMTDWRWLVYSCGCFSSLSSSAIV